MKKTILWICLLLMLFSLLCGCCLLYSGDWLETDELMLIPHMIRKICFVGRYTWNSGNAVAVLHIPDVCQGYSVTGLGGSYGSGVPAPFGAHIPGTLMHHGEGTLPENAEIEQYHLTIHLGKKINYAGMISMDTYHNMGNNRFVQILVTVNCDEENPWFYSENGKLYRRKDNSLVPGFFYFSDYHDSPA